MPLVKVPFQLAFGTNRTYVLASLANSRLASAEGDPKLDQFEPPFVEYCQVPLLLSTAVTAMPVSASGSASVISPVIRVETRIPK